MTQTTPHPAAPGLALRRPAMRPLTLSLLVTGVILLGHNRTLWARLSEVLGPQPLMLAAMAGAVAAFVLSIVLLLAPRWLQKPWLVALLIIGAVASYYTDRLGVRIDREMIQNAMNTTGAESRHLITAGFVGHVLLWGVLPAAGVVWVRLVRRPPLLDLALWGLTLALALGLTVGLLLTQYRGLSSVVRANPDLRTLVIPYTPLAAAVSYAKMMRRAATGGVVAPLGLDARPGPHLAAAPRPVVTVVVLGETVRAQNWGLNGYARDTTPELARRGVLNFPDVQSCGTSTAVSLPCMFSPLGHDGYAFDRFAASENLFDVLVHAGLDVAWWDNNTGSQTITARHAQRMMTAADDPAACAGGECTDDVFLAPLARALDGVTGPTVLFLHEIGSHGPAYFLRYPEGAEAFQPACRSADFLTCTAEEIANAYDNTILQTDRVLARMIDLLAARSDLDTALLYVSDHGESLGEAGLYLHGAPWFMAPDEQTRVPMVLWMSDRFAGTMGLDPECLAARAVQPHSHDGVFHSVLGLVDVLTQVRDARLDSVGACRVAP
jgi:lipid A ethanolaminephosphotransferase